MSGEPLNQPGFVFDPFDDPHTRARRVDRESREKLARRQQDALEARLAGLLNNTTTYLDAADAAIEHASYDPFRLRKDGVVFDADWIARRFKDEPRPILARLLSSRSDIAVRALLLTWLWKIDPWDRAARKRDWAACLAPLGSQEGPRGLTRSAHRALRLIEQTTTEHVSDIARWRPENPDAQLAWVYPTRPKHVYIAPEFFENGWHLVLTKNELAWYVISGLRGNSPATTRMRDRYVGFSKHITGSDWLPFSAVLDGVMENIDFPAPQWMARILLQTLGQHAHGRGRWPRVEFLDHEYPQLVVKGQTRQGKPAVLIGTNLQWRHYRTWTRDGDVELLDPDPNIVPWQGTSERTRTYGTFDTTRRVFHVHGPGPQLVPDTILITISEVTTVLGEPHLYATTR